MIGHGWPSLNPPSAAWSVPVSSQGKGERGVQLETELATLVQLVDETSIRSVIDDLYIICLEKAEHVGSHWQDAIGARYWCKCAAIMDQAHAKLLELEEV